MLAVCEAAENISENHLKKMNELLKKMKIVAESGFKEEFTELDIADNSLLDKMWNMVNLGQWTFITANISKKSLAELAGRHELLFQSLKERDSEKASQYVKNHIEELCEEILTKVEDL
ncbi:FCD domain protein [Clostridium magnum DSM 2767]|uniref:FCD domain protein n=2 Tax=Clostridium magnum TaxID=33954 RepID=A0A161YGI0_9CLOT|nr:FCD domain protein [Clostridium magnum DSM 2767]SHI97062.1 FCD domain-containing protein [Clostridium magnum DSM 2767]